jgi:CRISPR-associated protein Csm4
MTLYRVELGIKSAFATLPKGDTVFGQICWQIVNSDGVDELNRLLDGYTKSKPFLIVSDILINDSIVLPPIPRRLIEDREFDISKRKELKRRTMLSIDDLSKNGFVFDASLLEYAKDKKDFAPKESVQMRVKIDRQSGTTTGEGFDPFASVRLDYGAGEDIAATIYVLIDEEKTNIKSVETYLQTVGKVGFGKDATIGRGRFEVLSAKAHEWGASDSNAIITLSPSVIGEQGFIQAFYEPFTRWGKHGGNITYGNVWKNPVLMADSFACIMSEKKNFIGLGLGGDDSISKTLPQTVLQGYAPTIPIKFSIKD